MTAIARIAMAASFTVDLRIVEHHHESSVHVILLMTVKECLAGIVGHKLYLDGSTGVHQHHLLAHTGDLRAVLDPADLKRVPMQMHGMVVHAFILHNQAITLSGLQQKRVLW